MKLINTRIAHSDSIVSDDGQVIGVIYYNIQPLDDGGAQSMDVFRKWFKDAEDALLLFTHLEEKDDEDESPPDTPPVAA